MLSTKHPESYIPTPPLASKEAKPKRTLRQMRADSGYTGNVVATMCGTTYQSLRSWESGASKPNIVNVKRLLDIYGSTFEELDMSPFYDDAEHDNR